MGSGFPDYIKGPIDFYSCVTVTPNTRQHIPQQSLGGGGGGGGGCMTPPGGHRTPGHQSHNRSRCTQQAVRIASRRVGAEKTHLRDTAITGSPVEQDRVCLICSRRQRQAQCRGMSQHRIPSWTHLGRTCFQTPRRSAYANESLVTAHVIVHVVAHDCA